MRLLSFTQGQRASWGAAVGGGIADLGRRTGSRWPTLRTALLDGGLPEISRLAANAEADFDLDDVEFAPVIPEARKILCVGVNYDEHRREMGRDPSAKPTIFVRFADSLVGHQRPMLSAPESEKFDYEGELAIIIGRTARRVKAADALAHIAGYTCFNDGTMRDWQNHTTQFTPGKNFVSSGACGPWLVTADEIPDPNRLNLLTRLNGQTVQRSGTDQMIFDVPYLIEYLSTFTQLRPGDVIATGTPGGVGVKRNPPLFMKPGDTVEVEISGIGVLKNPIAPG